MHKVSVLLAAFITAAAMALPSRADDISLNGVWEYGFNREYSGFGEVPGLHVSASEAGPGPLWYRRSVRLPDGDWTDACIELKGARFRPAVYVNGALMSRSEGGMAPTVHKIDCAAVRPGAEIVLEVELQSLKDVPREDASWIPTVDQWRSNCGSCLWDDVILHTYRGGRIDRVLTWYDSGTGKATMKYRVRGDGADKAEIRICRHGKAVMTLCGPAAEGENAIGFSRDVLEEWTPDLPECYLLEATLKDNAGRTMSTYTQNFALKDFRLAGKQFELNGKPLKIRGGTVVWHRWMRDPEGREVGWNAEWFNKNIVRRLKAHGANLLRFHLGVPPERLLDLCDREGLAVQYEWNFFHGMPASYESLIEQYSAWLDMASRHPSVTLIHPYNETEGDQLKTVWRALDEVVSHYPPLVMEERDVIHVHKYWWSLFENLGLYYDSADQFDKAIMVDEFGGNYLDGQGNMGLYPSIRESFMRFLGPEHTAEMRLEHLDRSCAKVAEYWRRIGAAGVAPFVIASSQEDGCNWFMGPLRNGKPKTVWEALTVLWSPRAVSMDIWDCNFTPGQTISIPLHYFNDTGTAAPLKAWISILDNKGNAVFGKMVECEVEAYGHVIRHFDLALPAEAGEYKLRAELTNRPEQVVSPVRSDWKIRVLEASVPESLKGKQLYIPANEEELTAFAKRFGLKLVPRPEKADVVLVGQHNWPLDSKLAARLECLIDKGKSVVMLDAGEKYLGQGYPTEAGDLGPLQGVKKVKDPIITHYELFSGLSMTCSEMAEPESHIHPLEGNMMLWEGLPREATSLWNGLRGGLLVPAADMELEGLSEDAFLAQWTSRGADVEKIKTGPYFAYNLCGIYAFDSVPDNKALINSLRQKVAFLIEDAPALAMSLNAKAPVRITDLGNGYKASLAGKAKSFTPLACAGKNLTRFPVVRIGFGEGKGTAVISQLITAGRLVPSGDDRSVEGYGIRYDEAAAQMVLNMLSITVTE
ncbi:MAG: glycoside hydrolase [Bacteroidales bacterium]|nr:glycoside hydrolase [Bacteroidales bacterium]